MLPESSKSGQKRNSSSKQKSYSEVSGNDIGSTSDVSLPTPPDGGWGWVIVLGSFMAHLIADGCAFSFGVLYVELLDYFKEGKGTTAWIGSLFVSTPLITGPLASAITNRYGCRITTITGALVACCGFVLSAFSNSVGMLCFTFGIVSGIGLSMVYVPAVIIVAYYFEKKRAFATGIAVAGSGIGTFIFAPLIEILIEYYSWRGAVLIIGGIMLNIAVCGAVFRPLDVHTRELVNVDQEMNLNLPSTSQTNRSENVLLTNEMQFDTMILNNKTICIKNPPIIHSLLQLPTYLQRDSTDQGSADKANSHLTDTFGSTQSFSERPEGKTVLKKKSDNRQNNTNLEEKVYLTSNGQFPYPYHLLDRVRPLYRKDIFYRGSLSRTGSQFSSGRTASCPDILMKSQLQISTESKEYILCDGRIRKLFHEAKHIIKAMLDTSIMHSVVFVYFSISCMLLYMWYDVPYVYTPDAAKEMGISENKASYLLSIVGIFSTIGQILIGYLGDLPFVNALHLYNVLTSVAGIVTIIVPFITTYLGLCLYCASFGFFISGNYALTTIILVDLLSMEKLTNAYGLVMLAEGIANLVGPPIAGWMYDITGTYDLTFYIAGSGVFISGAMLVFIPLMVHLIHSPIHHHKFTKPSITSTEVSTSSSSACSPKNVPTTSFLDMKNGADVTTLESQSII